MENISEGSCRVTFLPDGEVGRFSKGMTLRDCAMELGIVIESICGGFGRCGRCEVIASGELEGITESELSKLGSLKIKQGFRLSCQARIIGDVVCKVINRTSRVKILESGKIGEFNICPDLKVIEMDLRSEGDDKFTLVKNLLKDVGVAKIKDELRIIRALSEVDFGKLYVMIDGGEVISIRRELGGVFGCAVDLGTTTIVLRLIDLKSGRVLATSSCLNSQKIYGDDIISRINFAIENEGGVDLLQGRVISDLNSMLRSAANKAGIDIFDIDKLVIVGNTAMIYFLLGLCPRSLAFAPFEADFRAPLKIFSDDIGLEINPDGIIYLPSILGSYIGSDMTATLTAIDPDDNRVKLVIDIGTNTEVALIMGGDILITSAPAGPAWEGGYIKCGTGAVDGAIERFDVRDGKLLFRTIGDKSPVGICGSGLIDIISILVKHGIIDEGGRIVQLDVDGEIYRHIFRDQNNFCFKISDGIFLYQSDIRAIQLAKAAIAAAVRFILNDAGINPADIDEIIISGAFGSHMRGEDAVRIGIIPDVDVDKVKFAGNTALSGAEMILLSNEARVRSESIPGRVIRVEMASRTEFQDVFVDAMKFKSFLK